MCAETSKHYGPYCTALPDALTPLLDRYADMLALEGEGGDEAYLFGPNHALDRPYESAAWSMAVKRAFAKHSPGGREVAPKTLRSSFITWIRSETDCPAVLKAAAHAQKHSEHRQQSESYDAERDTRLVKAAFDCARRAKETRPQPGHSRTALPPPATSTQRVVSFCPLVDSQRRLCCQV